MAIVLELPPDIEAGLLARAEARGLPVTELVCNYLADLVPSAAPVQQQPPTEAELDEYDRQWDEIADLIPPGTPAIPDEALRRENLYTREDELF